MLANYGYKDGSGSFFITIDSDKCNGCGECARVCPSGVFTIVEEDPNDPLREGAIAMVSREKKTKLKYECNPCKPTGKRPPLLCVEACENEAISHSW